MRTMLLATRILTTAILAAMPLPSARAQAPIAVFTEYRGLCDASAAVDVGTDLFVVANDEDNRLRLFRRGVPDALQTFDLTKFLEIDPKDEADIEGATRTPDGLVYWITSHGANRNAKPRPARRRLFATQIVQAEGSVVLKPMHRPYTGLVDDLAREPKLAKYGFEKAAALPPEAKGGLNIEGLASTPDGRLLIGFRNPLSGGQAIVVVLNNPDAVLRRSDKPSFEDAITLDLQGSGVRSLEYVAAKNAYLIVAGPTGDAGAFKLFLWTGPGSTAVTEIHTPPLQDLHPEAFVNVAGAKEILLVSDDGDRPTGGSPCKDAKPKQRTFRTMSFTLP